MIKITGLSYAYPLSSAPVLKNINLNIENGEFILITGSSGSGKSTLLYCLNGLIPHLFNGNLQGNVSINELNPRNLSISEISKIVGTVFQNPENQLFMPTVKEDIAFGCRNMGLSEEEVNKQVTLALNALNITSLEIKSIDELSAGQKQKVAIAGVYAVQPDIFLFDEPCTNLDQGSKKDFLAILKQLKKDGKTVIIAEHDSEELEELFDKQNGKCALSKIPLTFAVKHKDKNETTASLDRINNYGNYTIDNVQWVHKDINRMKWAYDLNYFISLCREVAKANPGE